MGCKTGYVYINISKCQVLDKDMGNTKIERLTILNNELINKIVVDKIKNFGVLVNEDFKMGHQ